VTAGRTALSRRAFLRLAGLAAAGSALAISSSACAPLYARLGGAPEAAPGGPAPPLPALLRRLTFGPRRAERARAAEIGLAGWIEEQLDPEALDDAAVEWRLRGLDSLGLRANELAEWHWADVIGQLKQATTLRRVYSRRQLYEVMVAFWSDHFNITTEKGDGWFLKTVDDREVIRPHALGRFRDLLWASAHSPAMLVYLDNQANRAGAPNENYARELLELHTLGVDGGYSQRDVMELARCLTGWTVREHFWRGEFDFDADQHDSGTKEVLGLRIAPAGQAEAEQLLEHLAVHPATAGFVCAKLVRRFAGEQAPEDLAERAAATFLNTGGDIRAVLRTILLDGLARLPVLPAKFRRPNRLLTAALRQLDAETDGGPALQQQLAALGEPLFAWPTPDGAPDRDDAWRFNLLPRWQFAVALARGEMDGTALDVGDPGDPDATADALAERLYGEPLPAPARDELIALLRRNGAAAEDLPAVLAAAFVAAPAFQWE
jgi:uncharacterized protein (DUF1800 family)